MKDQGTDAQAEYLGFASAQAGQLFRIACLMCGDWHEAQDLVQTALAKLYVAWGRASKATGPSWSCGIWRTTASSRSPLRDLLPAPDGITVSVQVGNGTLGGWPHNARAGWPWIDRAVPPGSMALWTAIAESEKWHL